MIRARGERRRYLEYHNEKEQLIISWPVTGGNSNKSSIQLAVNFSVDRRQP